MQRGGREGREGRGGEWEAKGTFVLSMRELHQRQKARVTGREGSCEEGTERAGGAARLTVLSEQMAVAPPMVSQADRTLWEQGKRAQVRIGAVT